MVNPGEVGRAGAASEAPAALNASKELDMAASTDQGTDAGRPPGRDRRWMPALLRRLTANSQELHADELRDEVTHAGSTPIAQCQNRGRVCVTGTLRSITLRPRAGTLTLEADLWDGSGSITLVWLGRREIRGVRPGRNLTARGRLTHCGERPTIFNPSYELRAGPGD